MGQLYPGLPHSVNEMAALMCCLPGEPLLRARVGPTRILLTTQGAGLASSFPSQHNGPGEVGDTNGGGRSHQAHPGAQGFIFTPGIQQRMKSPVQLSLLEGGLRKKQVVELSSFP